MTTTLLLFVACLPVGACRQKPPSPYEASLPKTTSHSVRVGDLKIVGWAIPFGDARKTLTLDYIHAHYDETASSIKSTPRMVVLHWSGSATLKSLYNTFVPDRLSLHRLDLIREGQLNVSAHFGVDRDGKIYQFMPETIMARHVIGLNRIAIGIENVGGPSSPLTGAQVAANAGLVRYLALRFPSIEYLIGHHEYGEFRNTPLWEEMDPQYFTNKIDPGDDFMRLVRKELSDLNLKARYNPADNK